MVMCEMLRILDRPRVKVVEYIDDLVILLSGMFPSVKGETMKGALGNMYPWVAR